MNELVFNNKGRAITNSLLVANTFGRKHKHVLEAIRDLIKGSAEISANHLFEESTYTDEQNGRTYPMFIMGRDGFTLLAMGFTGKKALAFKLSFISAFNKMEEYIKNGQQFQVPTSFREALILAAEQQAKIEEQQKLIDAKEEQVSELTNKVAEMSEKVSYLDQILKCKSTILVTTIAQDYGFSPKAFNKMLNEMGIQHKVDDQWILYAKYISEGYVHSEAIEIQTSYGIKIKYLTKWTQKGRLFLYDQLKANGILPLIEMP